MLRLPPKYSHWLREKNVKVFIWIPVVVCIILTAIVTIALFKLNKVGALIIILLAAIVVLFFVLKLIIYWINHINKLYFKLYSLIVSLKLEGKQDFLSVQKKERTIEDFDEVTQLLEDSINLKTNELRNRNKELKSKQTEAKRQNHELIFAYEALKESQDRYEKLVTNLQEEYFFYGIDSKGNMMYVSPSVTKILGYTISEYKKCYNEIYTKNPINKLAKQIRNKTLNGKIQTKFITEIKNYEGQFHTLEIIEIPIISDKNEVISIEGLAHDITEKHIAEELIKEQEEKYRQVFNHASDFIFIYKLNPDNSTGKFIEANNYTLSVLGYTQEELQLMTPDDLIAAEIWLKEEEDRKNGKFERIWEAKDGQILYVEISEYFFTAKGNKVGIAVARDITERKKALEEIKFMNEELINQKENLEALLDNLTQTQEQLVQSEKMAALGQLIAGVAHEINTPLGAIKASVGNLSDSLESALRELPDLFKSQSEENLNLFLKTFELAKRKGPELSSREIREKKRSVRKELRAKNVQSADMLADVLGYLKIFEEYKELSEMLKLEDALSVLNNVRNFISLLKNTNTIFIASEKASKVVFALKKYAHRDSLGEKVPTDVIDGIETVLTLYDNQFKQGVEVIRNYTKLPLVMSYQDEINQVWTNLIQNALQSMKQSGKLTIGAREDEKNIYISISDTGEGIEPNIIDKIFDPFFTTKKQGEGSGLGLDIVKKIIDKHGGEIKVQSEIGEGTTFIIKIPIY